MAVLTSGCFGAIGMRKTSGKRSMACAVTSSWYLPRRFEKGINQAKLER